MSLATCQHLGKSLPHCLFICTRRKLVFWQVKQSFKYICAQNLHM